MVLERAPELFIVGRPDEGWEDVPESDSNGAGDLGNKKSGRADLEAMAADASFGTGVFPGSASTTTAPRPLGRAPKLQTPGPGNNQAQTDGTGASLPSQFQFMADRTPGVGSGRADGT